MKCEKCGQEIQDDMNFCDKCGAPVVKPTPHLNNSRKKCKVCGADIEPDAVYCNHCGSPVEDDRRSNKKVIIAIMSIIIILLIGAIVYLAVSKGEPSTGGETPPSPEPVVDNDYITYTVICKDTEGNTLSSYSKQGLVGELITVTADPIVGYIARGESQSITLSENQSANVIVFVYGKEDDATIADRVAYTVICIDDLTGNTLQEKVYEGDIDTYITCTAPEIERYYPYDEEQTIYLSENETDNMVYFYYEEIADNYEMSIPDDNVLYYNGHAYYVKCSSDINSFWEAQSYCEEHGGYLAIINDANENKALYDYVFNNMGYRSSYFGFTDDGSEGTWYWAGNYDISSYTNWVKGQPDNHGNVENYALFYYEDTPYKWNDGDFGKDSNGNVYFLIEWDYSEGSATSSGMNIPSDAIAYNGHLYYLYDNDSKDWDAVLSFCESKGGYPTVINDSEENEFLYDYMISMGRNATLIGYTDRDTEGIWRWVDGDSSSFTDWGTNNEGELEPNADSPDEDYAQLDSNMQDGHWNDCAFAWDTASFICEWNSIN